MPLPPTHTHTHTHRWFASTPPIRMVIQLAHNKSEYPMAQTANSQCSQTLQVVSEQVLSVRFQKLSMKLSTTNRFVPKLIRVSPNASDGQRLTRCVSGFSYRVFLITYFHSLYISLVLRQTNTFSSWKMIFIIDKHICTSGCNSSGITMFLHWMCIYIKNV